MKAHWMLAAAAAAALAVASPADLAAQSARGQQARVQEARREQQARVQEARREQQRREAERARVEAERRRLEQLNARRDSRTYDPRNTRRYDPRNNRRDNGPAFCRSGEGHPVFGRRWCYEKGYSLGGRSWGDIFLRDRNTRRYQPFNRSILAAIIGAPTLGRFESYGHQYVRGTTTGRWVPYGNTHGLVVSIGGTPIARLIDYNGDGRIDDVQMLR